MAHDVHATTDVRGWHTLLRMQQEPPEVDLDAVIRQRIRGLRLARGWSLDNLAARCFLSPSTLSRIETGHRRIALDQLVPIAGPWTPPWTTSSPQPTRRTSSSAPNRSTVPA